MSSLIVEVCKINKVEKHPNADKLDIATIKGWNCIVGLNQYKVGDLVIYCPPDSIIPTDIIEKYKLEFLKKNGRVGTVKLRGVISEGLVLDIPKPMGSSWKEGLNVAIMLGITKWEPPQTNVQYNGGKTSKKKLNPYFDKYTDIENIKHFPTLFKEGEEVIITEKIHGANARYGILPKYENSWWGKIKARLFGSHEFVYGSHNVQITGHRGRKCYYETDIYAQAVKKLELDKKLPKDYVFYGEIYGKGIQDLTYGLEDITIRFFDIKNIKTGKYVDYDEFLILCSIYKLNIVPELYLGKYSVDIVKQLTGGKSVLYENQMREGCVIKPIKERTEHMGRVILKSINEEYLLRKNGTENK